MAVICGFDHHSIARHQGLKKGDDIISFNGRQFLDILDYLYCDDDSVIDIQFVRHGKIKNITIRKDENSSMGIDFGLSLEIKPMRCKNKCVFCFVDQLPKGLRDTLYVKDDDYRLSVICGNYISLTNLTDNDFKRIVDMRLSPLYISVHAFDGDVRQKMMSNPNAKKIAQQIKYLTDNGIILHAQVVLCEGLNDGEVLKDTITKLYSFYPMVKSLAIVPVGLTGHREGLYNLKPLSNKCLNDTIDFVENFNRDKDFCWCSDEFYVKTNREIPPYESYGDFLQIENGVGLVADFIKNFNDSLYGIEENSVDGRGQRVAIIVGESFKNELQKLIDKSKRYIKNIQIDMCVVKNEFFGGAITVSGLVVGQDIINQVEKGYDKYIVPRTMLREFNEVFLDNMTIDEVRENLNGKSLDICEPNGEDLFDIIVR